ncbi:MAG: hypothetical protein NTX97_04650 [Bacteroidetes bacterium]|nr:hypothetical protein [Bacteroidota bacterium]
MKTLIYTVLLSGIFLIPANSLAQEKNTPKTLSLRFNNYSVEQDKWVKEQLRTYHITYTCIPAGIVILELKDSESENNVSEELKKAKTPLSFSVDQQLSISDAEETCSGFRRIK